MTERRDAIAIGATLVAETAWLFPALGVFGVVFAQGASPLPLAIVAGLIGFGFIVGRIARHAVEDPTRRASFQALLGLIAVYLAMSVVAAEGAIDLLWGPRLFSAFSGNVAVGLTVGTVAAGFLWYRGVRIGSEPAPRYRLLQTFRIGVVVLALSFLAEQVFGVDCFTTIMLVPFFAVSLAGLAFARLPPGATWARMVVVAVMGVIGGGFVIGLVGAVVGGRGLGLLAVGWNYIVSAIGWLLNILLVPVLEVIFGFIAWLIGDSEPSKRDPTILKFPEGSWWERVDSGPALAYADLVIALIKYPLLILIFYLSYRLLLRAYRGYAKNTAAARAIDRESIQGDADAKADLVALALGLLPAWLFPTAAPAGPRYPKGRPGITDVYALYFDMLTAAHERGHDFVPSATPNERQPEVENAIPGAPVARITDCFNAACYGNVAIDQATVEQLRRELAGATAIV